MLGRLTAALAAGVLVSSSGACGTGAVPAWAPADATDATIGGSDAGADASDIDAAEDAGADATPDVDAEIGVDGGGDATDARPDSSDVVPGFEATVRVHVRYMDRVYDSGGFTGDFAELPARGFTVSVLREADESLAATGTTDDDGWATLIFAAVPGEQFAASVVSSVEVDGFRVDVRDRSRSARLYTIESDSFFATAIEPTEIELVATFDSGVGGAFNVADITGDGFRMIARFTDDRSPKLTYRWESGASFSCGSCYADNQISLGGQLEDPDEYDDDIILHEFGHYLVAHFSDDDSFGGTHRDRLVDPMLAYGEGLAYFISSAIRDDPTMVDNYLGDLRYIDYEAVTIGGDSLRSFFGTDDGTIAGRLREEIVAGLMWDAFDGPSEDEPWDTVSLGDDALAILFDYFGPGMPVDVGLRGVEVTDFLNAVACIVGDPAPVQALADDRDFPWDVAEGMRCDFKGKLEGR